MVPGVTAAREHIIRTPLVWHDRETLLYDFANMIVQQYEVFEQKILYFWIVKKAMKN